MSPELCGKTWLREEVAAALEQWNDLDFNDKDWKNQQKKNPAPTTDTLASPQAKLYAGLEHSTSRTSRGAGSSTLAKATKMLEENETLEENPAPITGTIASLQARLYASLDHSTKLKSSGKELDTRGGMPEVQPKAWNPAVLRTPPTRPSRSRWTNPRPSSSSSTPAAILWDSGQGRRASVCHTPTHRMSKNRVKPNPSAHEG